jgi:hypothetical protein
MDLLLLPIFMLSAIIGAVIYVWHLDHQDARREMRELMRETLQERALIQSTYQTERQELLDRLMAKDFQQFKDNAPVAETEEEEPVEETVVGIEDAREDIENG